MTPKKQFPNDQPPPTQLPDAELEVMACLWQKSEATVRDIREAMNPYRPMTQGAMITLLKRLEDKNMVTKRKGLVGKAFVYRPTRAPEPMYRKIMRDLKQRVFGGSGSMMVASLFQSAPPTEEELAELETLLNQMRRKRSKGEKP